MPGAVARGHISRGSIEMTKTERRVVITGGAGSLGVAVARAFLADGARVALLDRVDEAKSPAKQLGGTPFFIGNVDLADLQSAQRAMDEAARKLGGGIDTLVNIAGGFRWETVADGKLDTWDQLYGLNLRTAVCACKAVLTHLPGEGSRIINVGAAAAAKAGTGMGAYAASKAGVAKLTEALAEELKDKGINVNAVLPSIIDTSVNRADMPNADFTRWVEPAALADVIVFLASPAARAVTGASLLVAGRV
jgi:NAD(P)-dependent dehydrogenase (short-subunit alcohol dehydrogenase family)